MSAEGFITIVFLPDRKSYVVYQKVPRQLWIRHQY